MPKQMIEVDIPEGHTVKEVSVVETVKYGRETVYKKFKVDLEPEPQWRDATKQDVIDSLTGAKKFEIRVSDSRNDDWQEIEGYWLCGATHYPPDRVERFFVESEDDWDEWNFCQVREVPKD